MEERDLIEVKPENPFLRFFYNIGKFFHKLASFKAVGLFLSGLICVVFGLLIGFILLLCLDHQNAVKGLVVLLTQGASSVSTFARVLYQATPMMLSGLAISFAFKLGLFNIGITGQLTAGAFLSVVLGILGMPWYVCMLAGMAAGALMGFIPGLLKAKFNVNEVLSGIMLNWIIYYGIGLIGNMLIPSTMKDKNTPTELVNMPTSARMPTLGLDNILPGVSIGLIIAIVLLIAFEIILDKTTFGFELRLTGSNRYAAKYAGMNQTKNIILALTISGALAGICGYMVYANPLASTRFHWDSGQDSLLGDGFLGISVALIAQNTPLGCMLSSVLLAYLDSSQLALKSVSDAYNVHYTELIKAIIIYVASFSSLFNMLLRKGYEHYEGRHHRIRSEYYLELLTKGLSRKKGVN